MGYVSQELFNYPQGNVVYFVLTYVVSLQFVSHAAIAVNRFLALTDVSIRCAKNVITVQSDQFRHGMAGNSVSWS